MAEGKKSFLFYADWGDTFDELSNEDAGKLIKHLCDYVRDKSPNTDSVLIKAVFANMKSTLKRDLAKWDGIKQKRSDAGKKGGLAKQANARSVKQKLANQAVSVNDTVNVNVTVKDNETLIKDLCDFFNVNEIKNFSAFSMLNAFVNVSGIDTTAFNAYKEYKHTSGEKIHGWQAFIGSRERGFEDGAWASCDWASKIKDIPQQSNGIPLKPTGDDYNKWMRKHGQDTNLWMEACKKWRESGWESITPPGSTKRVWRKIKE